MPTQHSSFNNNKSWLPTNKLKHWTKFTTLLKCNFFYQLINLNIELSSLFFWNAISFLSLISTINSPKFHLNVCRVSLCVVIIKSWMLALQGSLLKPIVIIDCCCQLVHWLSSSIVLVDLCINYQNQLVYWLSRLNIDC
jgi:hypothetical protein